MANGVEIVDENLKTPYESLTPIMKKKYADMEDILAKSNKNISFFSRVKHIFHDL